MAAANAAQAQLTEEMRLLHEEHARILVNDAAITDARPEPCSYFYSRPASHPGSTSHIQSNFCPFVLEVILAPFPEWRRAVKGCMVRPGEAPIFSNCQKFKLTDNATEKEIQFLQINWIRNFITKYCLSWGTCLSSLAFPVICATESSTILKVTS